MTTTLPSYMLAAVVRVSESGPRLEVTELPTPVPGPGQVLVEVSYAGVNNIDQLVVQRVVPAHPAARGIPGLEASGIVVALGTGVTSAKVGDRVAWMGGLDAACYAQYAVVDKSRTAMVPESLGMDAAACIPVAAPTAMHLIALAEPGPQMALSPVRRMLVHAATGGVGVVLVQLLRRRGCEVVATTRSAARQEFLKNLGADMTLVPGPDGLLQGLEGQIDVSFNAIGGASVLRDIEALAPYGQIVLYGLFAGPPTGVGEALATHWNKSAALRSADIFTLYLNHPERFHDFLCEGLKLAAAGQLATPLTEVVGLRDADGALARLRKHGAQGKVLLQMDRASVPQRSGPFNQM